MTPPPEDNNQPTLTVKILRASIYRMKNAEFESCAITFDLPPCSKLFNDKNLLLTCTTEKGEAEKYCKEVLKITPSITEI